MQQLRLLATTVLLTLFIWASADQLVTSTAQFSVTIAVQSEPTSMMVITAAPGGPKHYMVTVKGRQKDVAALRDAGALPITLTLKDEIIADHALGPFNVVLRDELLANPTLFGSCVVRSVKPATLAVVLDRRVVKPVPVRLRSAGIDFAVDPSIDPGTVDVNIRQTLFEEIEAANPRITLDGDAIFKNQPADEPLKLQIPIQPNIDTDRGPRAAISAKPDTITVRATLRKQLAHGTIQAVPIKFLVSPNVYKRYNVEFRDENPIETLRIGVVGPAKTVEKLVSGETKTFAVIAVSTPDPFAEGAYQFYKPEFQLPPDVAIADEKDIPSFEIRLVPQPPAAQPNANP